MWYGSFDLHYREKIRIIKLPVIVVYSTNLQHSSWEIWNDAEEWFCFIGFDSGWRDGVCCFHIAIAMIYSDDFCVSEFSHKKYLRFRIDWFSRSYRCGTALLWDKHTKIGGKGIVGKLSWNWVNVWKVVKLNFHFGKELQQ